MPVLVIRQGLGRNDGNAIIWRCQVAEIDRHILIFQMRLRKWRLTHEVTQFGSSMGEQPDTIREQVIEFPVLCNIQRQAVQG